ncbi:MAG TPA: CBS domain-containing protein [Candidatus Nanoarchaeia archaeon]|nr:CBS domain-containing protein [Candidatus Nanoarchaeia archaeon]
MSTIRDLVKDREVYIVNADDTVMAAAVYMRERNVGAVPVLRSDALVGVFSERDIMTRVLIEQRDPRTTKVSDVMTHDPRVVGLDELVDRCMLLMKQGGFRHLPVLDGSNHIVGFLSLRDLLLHDLDEKEVEVRMMRAYMNSSPGE